RSKNAPTKESGAARRDRARGRTATATLDSGIRAARGGKGSEEEKKEQKNSDEEDSEVVPIEDPGKKKTYKSKKIDELKAAIQTMRLDYAQAQNAVHNDERLMRRL